VVAIVPAVLADNPTSPLLEIHHVVSVKKFVPVKNEAET
jgi:hypothetical protein